MASSQARRGPAPRTSCICVRPSPALQSALMAPAKRERPLLLLMQSRQLEGKIATAYTKMYFASVCIFFFASGPTPVESERGDRGHQRRWGSPRCGTSPACTIQCSWTARTGELARACPFSCAALRTKCRSPPDCRLTKTFSTLSFVTVGDKYGQTPYKAPRFSGKQFQTVGLKQGRTANTYFTSPSSTRRGLRGNRAAHARAHAFDRFVHRIRR
jgi:hypothetical protein